jgi:exosortase A
LTPATLAPFQADPERPLPARDGVGQGGPPQPASSGLAHSNRGSGDPVPATSGILQSALPALLVGLGCFGLFFHEEIAAAVRVWTSSTAYNHCFLVLPIAAYLAWDRRALIADVPLRPAPWLALAGVPLALAWLAAERIGLMEGRQLVAMCFVELLFLAVLGWPIWRRFAAPLLYLFFLVPFGAFAVPLLQSITARFTVAGLNLLGIPNFSDGYTIEIAAGTFYVAEACAGLRFLIAAVAFGALYACVMYRSPMRRLAFIAASVVIPVIANGLRALGIVVLGNVLGSAEAAAADHVLYGWIFFSVVIPVIANGLRALGIVVLGNVLGSAEAAAADHVLYGWIFFSIVILLLTVVGLPFRQEPQWRAVLASDQRRRPASEASPLLAACVVVLLAVAGPAAANRLDEAAEAKLIVPPPSFAASALCTPAPGGIRAGAPAASASGSVLVQPFVCGGETVVMRVEVFPPRASPSRIVAERRRLSGEFEGDDAESVALRAGGVDWRLTQTENPLRTVATALWIEGSPSPGGVAARLRQARNSLLGSGLAPVLVAVAPEAAGSGGKQARPGHEKALVQGFLDSQTDITEQIAAMAAAAAHSAGRTD